jgi:hypothetical protein
MVAYAMARYLEESLDGALVRSICCNKGGVFESCEKDETVKHDPDY